MNQTATNPPVFTPGTIYNGNLIDISEVEVTGPVEPHEIAYELGLWLASTEAFVSGFERLFLEKGNGEIDARNWYRASRLAKAGLLRSAELLLGLRRDEISEGSERFPGSESFGDLSDLLSSAIIANESLAKSGAVRADEWKQWRTDLRTKLSKSEGVQLFQNFARDHGDNALPDSFNAIIASKDLDGQHHVEVCSVVRKFAGILKALSVITRMLRNDEPLKPSLLIFTFVYEQTQRLIGQINHRLSELSDEETEFFISLDAASYTASLEIKKAFQQELNGVVGIRPAQAIYARIEVANSLLCASFEEIIAGLHEIERLRCGSDFRALSQLDQSLVLRADCTTRSVPCRKQKKRNPPASKRCVTASSFYQRRSISILQGQGTLERFSRKRS